MPAVGRAAGRCPGGSPLLQGAVGAWGGVRFPVVLVLVLVLGCEEVLQGGGERAGGPAGREGGGLW